jgi:RNA polymerase sigma-70 factor (ECF subfamily)
VTLRSAHNSDPPRGPVDQATLAEALAAAQGGDEQGFTTLYCEFAPRLLRYATGLMGQDADDVAAEAWMHIARDIRAITGDVDAFAGWAARIVRNRAIDMARYRARRPSYVTETGALPEFPTDYDSSDEVVEQAATRAAIEWIASLPKDQADAVLLRVVVGLDTLTAAQVLGKRPGAVRVAAHRGLKALARNLEATKNRGRIDEV